MNPFRSRLLAATLPLALAGAAASCSDPVSPPAPGPLLFEVEVISSGSGLFWRGFSIDAQGGVYSYDIFTEGIGFGGFTLPEGDEFTAGQLAAKYAHNRVRVATLSPGEVTSRYAEVGEVLRGRLNTLKLVCPDFANERFYALVYDPAGDRYRRVLLHQRGAVGRANTSPAARDLYHWLVDVLDDGDVGPNECDPYGG